MPAKKKTTKKTTAKKVEAPVEKEVKATKTTSAPAKKADKKATKTPAKAATKKTATKEPTKKASTKSVTKEASEVKETKTTKATPKKTAEKKVAAKKAPAKKATEKKATTKKATPKKPSAASKKKEKLNQYNSFSLETCIDMAKAMGVDMGYDQYAAKLLESSDLKKISKDIVKEFGLKAKDFSFDEDGYDLDLIPVLVSRMADTVDVKASDFDEIASDVKAHETYEIKDDSTANNDEYNAQFDLVKRILMVGQKRDIHTIEDITPEIQVNPTNLIVKFMDLAYEVLKLWQYEDVKFYQNFIFEVLSQYEDLHDSLGNRAMMDVADLYIKHGDYGRGDADYGYILRENDIKDYIFYRYANVYFQDIDTDKARSIASQALQFVDDRFTYYPNIIQILEA